MVIRDMHFVGLPDGTVRRVADPRDTLAEEMNKPHQCPACGAFGLHACPDDSPWRSLKDDPPSPVKLILVRRKDFISEWEEADGVREKTTHQLCRGSALINQAKRDGFTEWMEIPA